MPLKKIKTKRYFRGTIYLQSAALHKADEERTTLSVTTTLRNILEPVQIFSLIF